MRGVQGGKGRGNGEGKQGWPAVGEGSNGEGPDIHERGCSGAGFVAGATQVRGGRAGVQVSACLCLCFTLLLHKERKGFIMLLGKT